MNQDIFRIDDSVTVLDGQTLLKYINKNKALTGLRYGRLWGAYNNDYDILHMSPKPKWKPDVRVPVNFSRAMTDVFEGFFIGIPVRVTSDDNRVYDAVNVIDNNYDSNDINAEMSLVTSIYGRGYRLAYTDENGDIGTACTDPSESFMIYSESINPRPRFFVRYYTDTNHVLRGSISDDTMVRYWHNDGGIVWDEAYPHRFQGVPAVEFVMNSARRGIFEDALPMINAFNKALSEIGNDVESFAEAYMKVLGADLDKQTLQFMRDYRVINFKGADAKDVAVEFLQKPMGSQTQEAYLNRLNDLIYAISMIANIFANDFATTSGIALKYKMDPMVNLADKKWSKMSAGLRQYYRIVCSNPVSGLRPDDYKALKFVHQLNYPADLLDQSQTAAMLNGIVSHETQLSVLSFVPDPKAELARIDREAEKEAEYQTNYPTNRTVTDVQTTGGEDNDTDKPPADASGIAEA